MSVAHIRCRYCKTLAPVRIATDGRGGLVTPEPPCGCSEARKRGLCIDCGDPATTPRNWRCEPCTLARRYSYQKKYLTTEKGAKNAERNNARRRKKRERNPEETRAKDRERRRARADTINANRRRRNLADAGAKKKEYRLRYERRFPDRIREQTRKQNARPERQAAKREYQHRFTTKYVGEGIAPTCRKCGAEVEWGGKGRPRLDCFKCRPPKESDQ